MSRRSTFAILAIGLVVSMTILGLVLTVVFAVREGPALGLGQRVAIVEVDGLIADDADVLRQIRRFRDDASVRAFVVEINSPGGVVGPSQSIYQELRRLRSEDGRPVIASIGAVGASGGYYVALAADTIVALPGSITGSIGVVMQFPDASELMDHVGVRMEVIKTGEFKDLGVPFRAVSDGDREVVGALLDDVFDQFVAVVVEERGLEPAVVRGIADGRILSGRQALEHGLVDRMGNVNDAIALAGRMAGLGDDPRVVRPAKPGIRLLDLFVGAPLGSLIQTVARSVSPLEGPRLQYVVPF